MGGSWLLARWFLAAAWRAQRGRWLLAAAAVGVGVALATAIHSVNTSALDEFQRAIDAVNGEATVQVVARAGFMDERVFDAVLDMAERSGIAAASPVLALDLPLQPAPGAGARRDRLTLLGIDVFRAARATASLLPGVDEAVGRAAGAESPLFADDTIFLSAAAQEALGVRMGEVVTLHGVRLRVAGRVAAQAGQRIAVMDLGAMQWRFGALGKLSRIDLKLAEGTAVATVAAVLAPHLGDGAQLITSGLRERRMSNLSRAYRVNLNVLALVALFTGAFLVFSAVGLAAVRARPQLSLLAVLGATQAWLLRVVLLQGALVALIGSVAGVGAGLLLARALLSAFGGDLGGGYFPGVAPALVVDVPVLAGFVALGIAVGLAAAWLPAREMAQARPAEALRGASRETALRRLAHPGPSLVLMVVAGVLLLAPPIDDLPLAAYAAIACILLAAIGVVPWLVKLLFARAQRFLGGCGALTWLAFTRVAQAPGQAGGVIAGVVASFALTVAMVIMVASFRLSVTDWLVMVLPADLYARAPGTALAGGMGAEARTAISAIPGVARSEFARSIEVSLDPARPAVGVSAREFDPARPQTRLPLVGAALPAPPGVAAVYVSEAMVDLYGLVPGRRVRLPFSAEELHVAGVYRDYARQHGSVTLARSDYQRLSGDASVSDAALWLAPGADAAAVAAALAQLMPGAEQRSAGELRELSLRIFDRSFAMTYLLEAAALLVALFGVASSYAAQALERAREFGVLRHLGLTSGQIVRQVSLEGALLSGFGALWGTATGWVIGLVLIHRVNPQSFHWTMEARFPLALIAAGGIAIAVAGALAAALAVRSATGPGPLAALKEDW